MKAKHNTKNSKMRRQSTLYTKEHTMREFQKMIFEEKPQPVTAIDEETKAFTNILPAPNQRVPREGSQLQDKAIKQ